MTLFSNAFLMYYEMKLNEFNPTFYELGSSEVTCKVWHEGIAGRGANEITSCIYQFLGEFKNAGVKSVKLYSDSCGGRNRKKNLLNDVMAGIAQAGI